MGASGRRGRGGLRVAAALAPAADASLGSDWSVRRCRSPARNVRCSTAIASFESRSAAATTERSSASRAAASVMRHGSRSRRRERSRLDHDRAGPGDRLCRAAGLQPWGLELGPDIAVSDDGFHVGQPEHSVQSVQRAQLVGAVQRRTRPNSTSSPRPRREPRRTPAQTPRTRIVFLNSNAASAPDPVLQWRHPARAGFRSRGYDFIRRPAVSRMPLSRASS